MRDLFAVAVAGPIVQRSSIALEAERLQAAAQSAYLFADFMLKERAN